ncbi:MAG: fimbrial biogenesis outer membrane usher protein [Alkalinema sp. RU_4_3]|nr:fimbrial biogenesis outer membrane usher protein [Alkalinema sp. RU_4_3]
MGHLETGKIPTDKLPIAAPKASHAHEGTNSHAMAPSTTQTASLFEQVFGARQNTARIPIPWWINNRSQGNILVNLPSDNNTAIEIIAKDFLAGSESFLRSDIQAKLLQSVDENGFLSDEVLRQQGLEVIFDSRRVELRIQLPPAQLKPVVLSLEKQAMAKQLAGAIGPAKISGYLNMRGSQSIDWIGSSTTTPGRQPLQIGLESALNWRGWVLESDAQFSEGKPLERGNIRLTHDDTHRALRYAIGDFSPPATGYQTSPSMLGIAVARNYSLQPDRITRPINQFQFFLERKSRVEVFSNGRSLSSLNLEPGTQDLRDLPLGAGINDVQLVITDDLGQVKRLDFATATASNLLAPGLQQFSYSLGIPSERRDGNFTYDWQQPTLNLAYRWGVNASFTTGHYLQARLNTQMLGWEGYWATPIGIWNWDAALSHHHELGPDMAIRLRYDYNKIGINNPTQRSFGFTTEYRGSNFMSLSDTEPNNQNWLDLNAYYSQKLFGSVRSNLNMRYQFGRGGSDAYQLSAGISKRFKSGLNLVAKISHRQQPDGKTDNQVVVNLNWVRSTPSQSFQAASTFSNQASNSHRLDWNYNSAHQVEGIKANLGLASADRGIDLTSRLAYNGNHLALELSHNTDLFQGTSVNRESETQFKFSSAIVFADGYWAFSRPVSNSFAIVVPHRAIKGQQIGVNSDGKGGYAAMLKRQPAVLPDLSAYQLSTLRLDAPNLPVGTDLGESVFKLLPQYKSGTLLKIGKDTNVFLRGNLQDDMGVPIEFATGTVTSLSDKDWERTTIFTNKVGRFALAGFKPGRYKIELSQPKPSHIIFEIPEGTSGVHLIEHLKMMP